MKLSIVIGMHNRFDQLKRFIESVFQETSNGVKVYVTNVGPTDGTIEYLKSIAS